ncbi:hypothetical protein [Shewanella sp. WPAGA9]|uniref:hypothetical protein n=1 Tax=Shewanella sp. ENK2 TaxID=2775245 RepID=UPI0017845C35|nr:hypothetical protein [Shewanella sp. WPAGA9]
MVQILSDSKKQRITTVGIHPSAMPAFEFSKSIDLLFDQSITHNLVPVPQLKHALTIHAVQIIASEVLIIAGLENALFKMSSESLKGAIVIIHPLSMPDDDIEKFAWVHVINNLLNSASSQGLGKIHDQLNETMPKRCMKALLGVNHLSESQLAKMISKTKNCIAKQKSKFKEKTDLPSQSIFETVIQQE